MVDASITETQFRCFWKLASFWGRELFCYKFTNVKAFGLGVSSMYIASIFLQHPDNLSWIAKGFYTSLYWSSCASVLMETSGLIARSINHVTFYFTHCYRGQCIACSSKPSNPSKNYYDE